MLPEIENTDSGESTGVHSPANELLPHTRPTPEEREDYYLSCTFPLPCEESDSEALSLLIFTVEKKKKNPQNLWLKTTVTYF